MPQWRDACGRYIFVHEFGSPFRRPADDTTSPVAYLPPRATVELNMSSNERTSSNGRTPSRPHSAGSRRGTKRLKLARAHNNAAANAPQGSLTEVEFDALSREYKAIDDRLLASEKFWKGRRLEGANYAAKVVRSTG